MTPRFQPMDRKYIQERTVTDMNGCWIWTGGRYPNGYGAAYRGGQKMAHRASWIVYRGPIPDGLQIDHLCRVKCCVNPLHLEPVTPRENTMRGLAPIVSGQNMRDRVECKQGHPLVVSPYKSHGGRRFCPICHRESGRASDRRRYPQRLAAKQAKRRATG